MNDTDDFLAAGSKTLPVRLHYLDWLRVIAILMVFLFHAVHPFDFSEWQVKNVEQSELLSIILTLLGLWGMPFFFLVAGAGSWFALQRRSSGQYMRERFYRLLIPLIIGTILFSPLQLYMEWANHVQRGVWDVTFREYVLRPPPSDSFLSVVSPRWFGYGFHLWFLAFLFSFALITLPLFNWLKKERGQKFISGIARLSERRGCILLIILPLALIYSLLGPRFPAQHDWADFVYQMLFFVLGFVLFADPRFGRVIQRDWWLFAAVPLVLIAGLLGMYLAEIPVLEWAESPDSVEYYLLQIAVSSIAVCCCLTMIFIGIRFLNFTNQRLRYGQEAALPFFMVHQPVIIAIAFFVVQWRTGILLKLPVVVLSSLLVSFALVELIRRNRSLRLMFGMKTKTKAGRPAVVSVGS